MQTQDINKEIAPPPPVHTSIDVRERVWCLEGPKQNDAKIIISRDFQCALVHYILHRCYKLLLLTVIYNGYQLLLLMVISFNRS